MPEPLLLLPGMMCDARLFWHQISAFSALRAVHAAPLTGGNTIEAIADAVLEHAPPRFALLGLSMGGIVSMELLARAPERITRVALLDTNPMAELPSVAAAREPQIVGAKMGRLSDIMREEMKPNYLAPGPHRAEILDLVMQMANALGPEVFIQQSRALQRRPDQQKTLRRNRHRTLVLCGAEDALCPPRRHEFMAEIMPNASLRIIEGAGHLPTLEQPEATTAAIKDWLEAPLG